jgi:transcription initiation factor IIE alpha subunit
MKNYLQSKFIKFLVKDIFNTITEDDILTVKKGKMTWRGKELGDEEIATLKIQAKNLSESILWKVLKSELKWLAIKTLMENGKDGSDIRIAQILGYLTNEIDKKLKAIGSLNDKEGGL